MLKAFVVVGLFILVIDPSMADEFASPFPPKFADGSQRAFPTAEGYGSLALGGRGGRVSHVTNLNDSGPGSLRDILEVQKGPRTVVFDVGGIIDLRRNIVIRRADGRITVAGQTAPGDGVCLRGGAIIVAGSDVIIRHLCIRRGDGPGSRRSVADGLGFGHARRSIADHMSVSWTLDESMSMWGPDTQDITVQYSLFYEPLNGLVDREEGRHGVGPLIGNGVHRASFHHNIVAHFVARGPQLSDVQDADVINNIHYNWRYHATLVKTSKPNNRSRRINVISNVYRAGPDRRDAPLRIKDLDADAKVFFAGNSDQSGSPVDTILDKTKRSHPDALTKITNPRPAYARISVQPASAVWKTLPDKVGARVPAQDEADALVIRQIRDGSGTIVDCVDKEDQARSILVVPCEIESGLGRFPDYKSISRPAGFDSDKDGMPDAWERSHGLNPKDPEDRWGDMVGDGWTNLEYYLNQLAGDY